MLQPLVNLLSSLSPAERALVLRLGLVARYSAFDESVLAGLWGTAVEVRPLLNKLMASGVVSTSPPPAVVAKKGSWYEVTPKVADELAQQIKLHPHHNAARNRWGSWALTKLKELVEENDLELQTQEVALYASALFAGVRVIVDDYISEVENKRTTPESQKRAHAAAVRALRLMPSHPKLRHCDWCIAGSMTARARGERLLEARFCRAAGIIDRSNGELGRGLKYLSEAMTLFDELNEKVWANDCRRRLTPPGSGILTKLGGLLSVPLRDSDPW